LHEAIVYSNVIINHYFPSNKYHSSLNILNSEDKTTEKKDEEEEQSDNDSDCSNDENNNDENNNNNKDDNKDNNNCNDSSHVINMINKIDHDRIIKIKNMIINKEKEDKENKKELEEEQMDSYVSKIKNNTNTMYLTSLYPRASSSLSCHPSFSSNSSHLTYNHSSNYNKSSSFLNSSFLSSFFPPHPTSLYKQKSNSQFSSCYSTDCSYTPLPISSPLKGRPRPKPRPRSNSSNDFLIKKN
jgi:hypothetical protein